MPTSATSTRTSIAADRGYERFATAHLGPSGDVLGRLGLELKDKQDVVFLFLDPFGVRGVEMAHMHELLSRPKTVSTELLINLNTPIIKRLAERAHPGDVKLLNAVLGGDWWRDVRNRGGNSDDYATGNCAQLRGYGFRYAGAIAVRSGKRTTKYHLAFCSRHPDAAVIMNDVMINAVARHSPGSGQLYVNVADLVLDGVNATPGIPRLTLWERILQTHFGLFKGSEYIKAVSALVGGGEIHFKSDTGRLNDRAQLWRTTAPATKAV